MQETDDSGIRIHAAVASWWLYLDAERGALGENFVDRNERSLVLAYPYQDMVVAIGHGVTSSAFVDVCCQSFVAAVVPVAVDRNVSG